MGIKYAVSLPERLASFAGKLALVMTLLVIPPLAHGQSSAAPVPKAELSIKEQIRAARAKADREEEASPKGRSWDRDANGRRPWDRQETPSKE
jgi:hypothetical protein